MAKKTQSKESITTYLLFSVKDKIDKLYNMGPNIVMYALINYSLDNTIDAVLKEMEANPDDMDKILNNFLKEVHKYVKT